MAENRVEARHQRHSWPYQWVRTGLRSAAVAMFYGSRIALMSGSAPLRTTPSAEQEGQLMKQKPLEQ
jgi:hypothetical protein